MLAACDRISKLSKELYSQSGLVPSIKFNVIMWDKEIEAVAVLSRYQYSAIRVIFELIEGLRLGESCADKCRLALDEVVTGNSLGVDVQGYLPLLDEVRSLKADAQLTTAEMTPELLDEIGRFIYSVNGRLFLSSEAEWLEWCEPLSELEDDSIDALSAHVSKPEQFKEDILSLYSQDIACSIGAMVIFPEDIYDSPLISLDKLNFITGNLYQPFRTLDSTLRKYDLTQGQRNLFKKTTCNCGGDLVVRIGDAGLTTLSCINPYCKYKMMWALADLISALGGRGVGAKSLQDAIEHVWYSRALSEGRSEFRYRDFFGSDFLSLLDGEVAREVTRVQEAIKNFSGATKELVRLSGLPYVGEYASAVISRKLLNSELDFIQFVTECRKNSVKDLRVCHCLYSYLDDIRELVEYSQCRDMSDMLEFNICITHAVRLKKQDGSVTKFQNKQQFIETLNELLEQYMPEKKIRCVWKKSMSAEVHVLINDSGEPSSKDGYARQLGIPVIESKDIMNAIEGVIASGEKQGS